jgi:hypothetical protein
MVIVSNCPGLSSDVIDEINDAGSRSDRAEKFGGAVAQAGGDLTALVAALVGASPPGVGQFQELHPDAVPTLIAAAAAVAAGDSTLSLELTDDGPVVSVVHDVGEIIVRVRRLPDQPSA